MKTRWISGVMTGVATLAMMSMGTTAFAKGGGAGAYLGLDLGLVSTEVVVDSSGTTSTSKSSTTDIDADLGYVFSSGFYLGAAVNSISSGDDTLKASGTLMGLGLGMMRNGWVVLLKYFLSGSRSNTSADGDKFAAASGLGFDLGYMAPLGSTFNLGVVLSYKSITYKTYTNASGTEVADYSLKVTGYQPKIMMAFMF